MRTDHQLCAVCGEKPRGTGGRLTRCLDCLKADVEHDRQQRDRRRREAEASALVPVTYLPHVNFVAGAPFHLLEGRKICGTCREEKPLEAFALHNGSRDGQRKHCRECCSTGRRKPIIETAEQRARRKERQSRPEWQASHREALQRWRTRNPAADQARRIAQSAVKAGKIPKSPVCQVDGCNSDQHLELHHSDYLQPLVFVVVCAAHHRAGHSVGFIKLKPGIAPELGAIPVRC